MNHHLHYSSVRFTASQHRGEPELVQTLSLNIISSFFQGVAFLPVSNMIAAKSTATTVKAPTFILTVYASKHLTLYYNQIVICFIATRYTFPLRNFEPSNFLRPATSNIAQQTSVQFQWNKFSQTLSVKYADRKSNPICLTISSASCKSRAASSICEEILTTDLSSD